MFNEEIRNRIRIALWAYAYEIKDDPLVTDQQFDDLALKIDLSATTGNDEMDEWFKENFNPYTGQWIHKHLGLDRLDDIYVSIRADEEGDDMPDLCLEDMLC